MGIPRGLACTNTDLGIVDSTGDGTEAKSLPLRGTQSIEIDTKQAVELFSIQLSGTRLLLQRPLIDHVSPRLL